MPRRTKTTIFMFMPVLFLDLAVVAGRLVHRDDRGFREKLNSLAVAQV